MDSTRPSRRWKAVNFSPRHFASKWSRGAQYRRFVKLVAGERTWARREPIILRDKYVWVQRWRSTHKQIAQEGRMQRANQRWVRRCIRIYNLQHNGRERSPNCRGYQHALMLSTLWSPLQCTWPPHASLFSIAVHLSKINTHVDVLDARIYMYTAGSRDATYINAVAHIERARTYVRFACEATTMPRAIRAQLIDFGARSTFLYWTNLPYRSFKLSFFASAAPARSANLSCRARARARADVRGIFAYLHSLVMYYVYVSVTASRCPRQSSFCISRIHIANVILADECVKHYVSWKIN